MYNKHNIHLLKSKCKNVILGGTGHRRDSTMAALLTSMVVPNTKQIFAKMSKQIFAKTSKQISQDLQKISTQVLVFVLCHSLKAGLNIYEAYMVTFLDLRTEYRVSG